MLPDHTKPFVHYGPAKAMPPGTPPQESLSYYIITCYIIIHLYITIYNCIISYHIIFYYIISYYIRPDRPLAHGQFS